jgi:NAD(P)H dehydrogenase (quinone)
VYAHPDERSLNAAPRDAGVRYLYDAGHDVIVSDLFAMAWKATLHNDDLGDLPEAPPTLSRATKRAYERGTLRADIRTEQAKLLAADAVVLQFPLWWYSTPAILKGWIDRVFAKGFAYGITDPDQPGRMYRYGDGPLSGRRAQVITTVGSPAPAMGPRGINGQLDQVLFPLLHGTLFYVGMEVLPPLAVHGADRVTTPRCSTTTSSTSSTGCPPDAEPPAPRSGQRSAAPPSPGAASAGAGPGRARSARSASAVRPCWHRRVGRTVRCGLRLSRRAAPGPEALLGRSAADLPASCESTGRRGRRASRT